eukprot:SAG22_NODE_1732_length_3700_cov_2.112746_3_plen_228_part_00
MPETLRVAEGNYTKFLKSDSKNNIKNENNATACSREHAVAHVRAHRHAAGGATAGGAAGGVIGGDDITAGDFHYNVFGRYAHQPGLPGVGQPCCPGFAQPHEGGESEEEEHTRKPYYPLNFMSDWAPHPTAHSKRCAAGTAAPTPTTPAYGGGRDLAVSRLAEPRAGTGITRAPASWLAAGFIAPPIGMPRRPWAGPLQTSRLDGVEFTAALAEQPERHHNQPLADF